MDNLLLRASDWSLACDNALLSKLQEMSDTMVRKAETVNSECDALMNDVDNLRSKITNVTNDFLVLANTNFVENTVEEFQEFDVGLQSSNEQPLPTKAEKEAMLLEKMKEAIQIGLRSQQENEAKKFKKAETLCNDSVESRNGLNLGYIIGSPKFFSSKYCGLKTGTPKASTPYAATEASNSGLEDSAHQFDTPSSDIPSFSQPAFVYQTPTDRPSSVASDSLFTSPVQAPGIPSLSSTPNTDASYSPAPISKSHQKSEAKYSPTPFSYIPVPARPPSTPSSSPVSSQADSFSDTDLTQRFTLPNELSTPTSPAKDLPVEVFVEKPELSMPQATKGSTSNVDDAKKQEHPEIQEQETEAGPKSPPVKAQPVHKFMNASVLSQLQSRIAAGPKPPIRSTSSVSEVPAGKDKPETQQVMEVPPVDEIFEAAAVPSVQKNVSTLDAFATTPPKSKVLTPQSKVQVLPSAPSAALKEPKESPKKASPSKQASLFKSEPKLSEATAPVKKSIFDSDSDDEDDFLFSTKPKKSLGTPKASIFTASSASPKKDIFGRTAVLDASSDDSDADGGFFKAAAPVSRGKDRSIFDDLGGSSALVTPSSVQNEPQQHAEAEANVPEPVDTSDIMVDHQLDQHREKPESVLAPTPGRLITTEIEEVDYISTDIPVEEVPTAEEPHLAETASTTTVVVQQSQSVTTTTTSTDSLDTARHSPDIAGVSEVTTITETTTVIEEIITVPESTTIVKIDKPVEPPQGPKSSSRKFEHPAPVPDTPESEEEDLFKDASIAPKKPTEHPVNPVVKPTQPSADVKPSSHPALTTVTAAKSRPVVKKSIFDSSDSDDDLFSTKAPKSRVISNTAGSSLFAPMSKDVKIVPPAESKPQKISVQPPVPEPLIPTVEPSSEPVILAAAPKLPELESENPSTVVTPSLDTKTVQQPQKPQVTTASTEIKPKSLFDSTDSDSDDLFSTKPKPKKATPKSIVSTASSKSAASTVSLPKPQSSVKPKKTSKLFDDSDDDDDDLFTSKSSKLGSAKSSLSALPIASTSTSSSSIPSPSKLEPTFQPTKTATLPEEPQGSEPEPKANVKEKFASVSKNLESLFGAKPKLPGQPQPTQATNQKPSYEDQPAVSAPPVSASQLHPKSISFEDQPDSSRLLQCVTKNRPKFTKQRRPPTKGLQKKSAKPESVPEESPAEPGPEPESNSSVSSVKQEPEVQAPDFPEPKVIQVPEVERDVQVQSPPLPPPVPSQTESSDDEEDDEDSLFPRNRVYYD